MDEAHKSKSQIKSVLKQALHKTKHSSATSKVEEVNQFTTPKSATDGGEGKVEMSS